MDDWLTALVLVLGLGICGICGVLMVRDVEPQDRTFVAIGVLELVLLVQLVAGSVHLAHTHRDVNGTLFVSYLVGIVLALPIGVFWSLAERSRSGTAVLAVAVLTVLALQLRLEAIWGGAGA